MLKSFCKAFSNSVKLFIKHPIVDAQEPCTTSLMNEKIHMSFKFISQLAYRPVKLTGF